MRRSRIGQYRPLLGGASLVVVIAISDIRPADAARFVAYQDRTAAQHQQYVDTLGPLGYRIRSLSVYGTPSSARYAAIWVESNGPAQRLWHGLSSSDYDHIVKSNAPWGTRPQIVTVTSSGSSTSFACVMVTADKEWFARHDLNGVSFEGYNRQAKETGFILTCAAMYGSKDQPKYAGIWVKNTQNLKWSCSQNMTAAQYQSIAENKVEDGYRIAYVAVSPHRQYVAVFYEDTVSWDWTAAHDLTSLGYQLKFDALQPDFDPIHVAAGGSGDNARFAAIFRRD